MSLRTTFQCQGCEGRFETESLGPAGTGVGTPVESPLDREAEAQVRSLDQPDATRAMLDGFRRLESE